MVVNNEEACGEGRFFYWHIHNRIVGIYSIYASIFLCGSFPSKEDVVHHLRDSIKILLHGSIVFVIRRYY
jgi:hypothetical protein